MPEHNTIDQIVTTVSGFDRDTCKAQLRRIGKLHLDFTDSYLDGLSIEQVRHLTLAAMLQGAKREQQGSCRVAS